VVTVNGSDQALTGVRASRGYRCAVVAQRVLAIAFLVLLVAFIVTDVPTVFYLSVAVSAAGAMLGWAVVAVLAVRLARRPGGRFDPTELVPLATRYFHDLLGLRS
jgi:hypothetical protein